ncbi:hypothetical protein M426DRAFT_265408 [Hypoxylon sp. CI-4A]|nr:hypothetical protein M426DRAFT_265408 [Hypoxylon sp. CI-4A]
MSPEQPSMDPIGADNGTQVSTGTQEKSEEVQPHSSRGPESKDGDVFESAGEQEKGIEHGDGLKKAASKRESQSEPGTQPPSTSPRRAQSVPRSQRRGLFGRFTLIPEVTNPHDYNNSIKWMMTIVVALSAATSSMGSSIFYPALSTVASAFDTTPTIANLSLAFYMLAMAFTPMWWSAFSEKLGRRTIYLLSFALFVIFSVISAISVNIAMLIVIRVLYGGAAASVQAVGAGTVADIWEPRQRGRAMGIFYLGPLCGPGVAPIIGGALTQGFGWRSTLWFLAIFAGVLFVIIFLCLPETLMKRGPSHSQPPPNAQQQGAEPNPKSENRSIVQKITGLVAGVFKPMVVLTYMRYPAIIVSVYSAAIAFGSLYVINISLEVSFASPPYNFTTIEVGLLYIAPTLGYASASLLGGRWADYIMHREAVKAKRYDADGKLIYLPEDRVKENFWLAASLYPAGMIWYGWTADKGIHWIVPCIANFFFGIGSMLVFSSVTTMLTEFTPKKSSAGVAVNNLVRNILACVGAIVTQPLVNALGTGWTCTMVGLFAWVTGNAAVLALKTQGHKWRVTMDRNLNPPDPRPST